jgi:hypothetical protein
MLHWIDSTTALLDDKSIINFLDNGDVEFYPNTKSGWKKIKNNRKDKNHMYNSKFGLIIFHHNSKEDAIRIWENIDMLLNNQTL